MDTMRGSWRARGALLIVFVLLAPPFVTAENIDPDGDGSQYAYGENIGWLNAEPSGEGGPGVEVADFELTGFMWGENVGWVSLSCKNTSSCGTVDYGVLNDGAGALSGYAWGENLGWIHFAPATAGVFVDPETGEFSGRAWSENAGWITFASSGFAMKSAWACGPEIQPPSGSPELLLTRDGDSAELSWAGPGNATGYDVVTGGLGALRASASFTVATDACLADNTSEQSASFAPVPVPGDGAWFLVRGLNCKGAGSYDSGGAAQTGPRDASIAASGAACP